LPRTRKNKEEVVAHYVEQFARSQALIFADYRGLTVADVTGLRSEIRESGNSFLVVKNTLAKVALERAGLSVPEDVFFGPVAIGLCFEDVAPVAKALDKIAQDTKILNLKGALLGDVFVGPDQAKALADLPSREVLLAQVVGAVQAPIAGLVNVLAGPMRGLVNVLTARQEQLAV